MSKTLAEMVKELSRRPVPERVPAYAVVAEPNDTQESRVEPMSSDAEALREFMRLPHATSSKSIHSG